MNEFYWRCVLGGEKSGAIVTEMACVYDTTLNNQE